MLLEDVFPAVARGETAARTERLVGQVCVESLPLDSSTAIKVSVDFPYALISYDWLFWLCFFGGSLDGVWWSQLFWCRLCSSMMI